MDKPENGQNNQIPSRNVCTRGRIICITLIIAGFVVLIAIPSITISLLLRFLVFTTVTISPSLSDLFANAMANGAIFPNKSSSLTFSSITLASSSLNPIQVTTSVLQSASITDDTSNSLIVSGRQSFYYVLIPTTSSGVSAIGVRFGSTSILISVPISLASTSGSGVRSITLSGTGTLYEIKVSTPSNICSISASCCTSFDWTAYAILSSGTSAAAGPSTTVYASCGDQCSSGSNSTTCSQTCQTCASQTVSGADTPVSRQYYMGTSKGSINFQYETYSVKDRIIIVYENTNIFDSGCVGTNGLVSKTVTFSGQSKEIRVDVEPNCEGTTGTAWYFITGCASR